MTPLNNINFELLLKSHNGNFERAKAAWDKILALGKFGQVPFTYAGGLDVQGMRVLVDERKQKQATAIAFNPRYTMQGGQIIANHSPVESPEDLEDNLHKIEDIASGDDPHTIKEN